jgi:hypothetical protein
MTINNKQYKLNNTKFVSFIESVVVVVVLLSAIILSSILKWYKNKCKNYWHYLKYSLILIV